MAATFNIFTHDTLYVSFLFLLYTPIYKHHKMQCKWRRVRLTKNDKAIYGMDKTFINFQDVIMWL